MRVVSPRFWTWLGAFLFGFVCHVLFLYWTVGRGAAAVAILASCVGLGHVGSSPILPERGEQLRPEGFQHLLHLRVPLLLWAACSSV
jgi:hypothetical protein